MFRKVGRCRKCGNCMKNSDSRMIFEDPMVRRKFIVKVLLIVALNLAITTLFAALAVFHRPTRWFFRKNWWLWIVAMCILIPIQIILCYFRKLFRMSPLKYILLALYVFAHTILVCMCVAWFHPRLVLMAFGIVTAMVFLLALFARFAPCDFTGCWTLVFVLCLTLLLLCILSWFFPIIRLLYYSVGVLAYSIFLVIDLQLLMGGKTHKRQFDEEDFIIAALEIYGDIITLFKHLLRCIGILDDDDDDD